MGLFITYGVYRVRTAITAPPTTTLEDATEASPSTTTTPALIAIHNPEHGQIVTDPKLTVTGTTTANDHVVLFVNGVSTLSTSDETGNFSFEAELEEDANFITVHVIQTDGTTTTDERVVVLSSALEDLETADNQEATQSATATGSAQPKTTTEEGD